MQLKEMIKMIPSMYLLVPINNSALFREAEVDKHETKEYDHYV